MLTLSLALVVKSSSSSMVARSSASYLETKTSGGDWPACCPPVPRSSYCLSIRADSPHHDRPPPAARLVLNQWRPGAPGSLVTWHLPSTSCQHWDNTTTPYHTTPHHTLPHHTTPHTTPHHTTPHNTTQHHTTPHLNIPHHTLPHHTTPYHTTPHLTTPLLTTPHLTTPQHAIIFR